MRPDMSSEEDRPAADLGALPLSTRVRNILNRMGVRSTEELRDLSKRAFVAEWRSGEGLWREVEPHVRRLRG